MKRTLVHPQLVGKLVQKVEEDEEGNLFIHTKHYVLEIGPGAMVQGESTVSHVLRTREKTNRDPIVISGKINA